MPTQTECNVAIDTLFSPSSIDALHEGTYFQVCDTYIVIKGSNGLWLMDQHAVHERILYEKFKEESSKDHSRQALLISEVVSLSPDLFQLFEEHQPLFSDLNFCLGQKKLHFLYDVH